MVPIQFCVVGKTEHGYVAMRFFLRDSTKARSAERELLRDKTISRVETILLCERCGTEMAACNCTPRQIAALATLQAQ